jgi:hypothetical protein
MKNENNKRHERYLFIFAILLLLLFSSIYTRAEVLDLWVLLDNDTLVPVNETYNVNIGENDTTDYKLKVNGTSFLNGSVDISGNVVLDGYHMKIQGSLLPEYIVCSSGLGSHSWSFRGSSSTLSIRDMDAGANVVQIFENCHADTVRLASTVVYFNLGLYDTDFNVRGDRYSHLFYVNAGTDRVGILDSTPDAGFELDVNGDIQCTTLTETSDKRIKNVLFEVRSHPNALKRFCDNLSIIVYNPIWHNETIIDEENETYYLEFGEINHSVVEVGLIAQDVYDLCINFSNNQNLNELLANSIVHKPNDENLELWGIDYRMISLLYMENNKLRIENIENFLSNYGYNPEANYE